MYRRARAWASQGTVMTECRLHDAVAVAAPCQPQRAVGPQLVPPRRSAAMACPPVYERDVIVQTLRGVEGAPRGVARSRKMCARHPTRHLGRQGLGLSTSLIFLRLREKIALLTTVPVARLLGSRAICAAISRS